jgi:phytoene dehydrogenase-like protein
MTKYQTIVVGGGIAGLTAAAYNVRSKLSTLLIEKESYAGGLVGTFDVKGYKFDRGARSVESSGIVHPMLKNLGIKVDFVRTPINMIMGDQRIILDSFEDIEKYKQALIKLFPSEAKAIDLILRDIYQVMENMDVLYGIENPLFIDKPYSKEYLSKTLLPWLFRFLGRIGKISKDTLPINEHLARYTKNQVLIDLITQHFFEATPANFALSYFTLYLDYQYPLGGTGSLPNAVERFFLENGGKLQLSTKVEKIDLDLKKVFTNNGEFEYDELIWAGDMVSLYRLASSNETKIKRIIEEKLKALQKSRGADSVASVYYAVDLPPSFFLDRVGGHTFYTPEVKGLTSLPISLIKDETGKFIKDKNKIFDWIKKNLEINTYELSIPAVRDASLAPANKSGLIASTLFDYELAKHILNLGLYDELKTLLIEEFTRVLDKGALKGFKKKVEFSFAATPVTIESFTLNYQGSLTGWSFINNPFPAVFKFTKVASSVKTKLPNISQCGQWTFNPAGIPIAVLTGKLASDLVVKKLSRKK